MQTRPFVPGQDEDFVFEVYCCSRSEEVSAWSWSGQQVADFLRMQHRLQLASYRRDYRDAAWRIVHQREQQVGYLCVAREARTIRLVDIALLRSARGRGLGETLLRQLLADAAQRGAEVRLSVRRENPARRLYERLGFVTTGSNELCEELVWSPLSGCPDRTLVGATLRD